MLLIDAKTLKRQKPVAAAWPALRTFSKRELEVFKTLSSGPETYQLKIGANAVRIAAPVGDVVPTVDACITIELAGRVFGLWARRDILTELIRLHGYSDTAESLDPDTLLLILEHLAQKTIVPLLEPLRLEMEIISFSDEAAPSKTNTFGARLYLSDAHDLDFLVSGAPEDLTFLVGLVSNQQRKPDRAPKAIPLCARLVGPSFLLARKDLTATRCGDGFMTEIDWNALNAMTVACDARIQARARRDGQRITLTSRFTKRVATSSQRSTPVTKHELPDLEATPVSAADIPVKVTLVLDQIEVTANDLQELAEGDALPFCDDLTTDVLLHVNGAEFARGDLIRIEDRIAVRVKDLF